MATVTSKISIMDAFFKAGRLFRSRLGASMVVAFCGFPFFEVMLAMLGQFLSEDKIVMLFRAQNMVFFGIAFFSFLIFESFLGWIAARLSLQLIDNSEAPLELSMPTGFQLSQAIGVVFLHLLYLFAAWVLIIPAFIVTPRLMFFFFAFVDRNTKPQESLTFSWHITRGSTLRLVLFSVICECINIIAFIPYGAGLILTLPLQIYAAAYLYRRLIERKNHEVLQFSEQLNVTP